MKKTLIIALVGSILPLLSHAVEMPAIQNVYARNTLSLNGKWNYINYLRGKFNSILENISSIPRAEIAYFKYCYSEIDKGCIVLTQKENQCSIIIETKNGKITKANMIGIPSPEGAVRFDYKPR